MSFRFLTAGESHGKALVGILEGIPSGLAVTSEVIHEQLKRRKLGFGRGARQKIETDEVEILSGVRHGKTLGSPIALLIPNRDWSAWQDIMRPEPSEGDGRREVHVPRPGHADLIGGFKYQHEDMRNVLERSSARETAIRVGLGTVARCFLSELGVSIGSRVVRIGSQCDETPVSVPIGELNQKSDGSPVRVLSSSIEKRMIQEIEQAQREGDTLGGEFEVYASGVPAGIGSYVQWDRRLEGEIGKAFLSLNAIKGVEVGLGFREARLLGSQVHDTYEPSPNSNQIRYRTNHSGGIDGGMSTGQPLIVRAAMKPLSTLMKPLASINLQSGQAEKAHIERSDVCAVPAAAVIGESLLALVVTGQILEKFGGDSMKEIVTRVREWKKASPIA